MASVAPLDARHYASAEISVSGQKLSSRLHEKCRSLVELCEKRNAPPPCITGCPRIAIQPGHATAQTDCANPWKPPDGIHDDTHQPDEIIGCRDVPKMRVTRDGTALQFRHDMTTNTIDVAFAHPGAAVTIRYQ